MLGLRIAWVALLIGAAAGCGPAESPDRPDASVVSDDVYTNSYLGLSMPIPDGWFVASEDSEEAMRKYGEAMVGDDPVAKAAVEASRATTFQLLTLSEHEMGAPVDFNPNLVLMAERVSHIPGVKTGKDYLFHLDKALMSAQLPYEVAKAAHPTTLGDRPWFRADYLLRQPQMLIAQSYLSTKKGDFVISIILTAMTEEQKSALEEIASAVKVD